MTDETPPAADIVRYEVAGRTVTLMPTENAAEAIMDRILASPSLEDVFDAANTTSAEDVDSRPFMLKEVSFYKSDFEEGPGVYAIIYVDFVDDGTSRVLTCGGGNVVAQLIAVSEFGMPPWPICLKKNTRPTSRGFFPLWLHRV